MKEDIEVVLYVCTSPCVTLVGVWWSPESRLSRDSDTPDNVSSTVYRFWTL